MIETISPKKQELLLNIDVLSDDDVDINKYCPYKIIINTSYRIITIFGEHDSGPDIIEELKK